MMKIYNSLTRNKEEFSPVKKGKIGMYVCGPTVYDEPHIGHARSAYIFDVIRRYLVYKGYEVTFVRNVTDVDDKIIDRARQESKKVEEISRKYLDAYHEDMALLGIGKPDKEPKATEYIPKMIKFIGLLIKRGRAYISDQDVYFDIRKTKDYGKLSNQKLDKMEIGTRPVRSFSSPGKKVTPGENKKDPLDFALWKKAKEGEPSWKSPWGRGRPGWHIECSVMSSDILGLEFDIHGGGIDLIFPHHENEIAQSEGAGKRFARYWVHNGLLTINSEKMAKSLGNFISVKDILKRYPKDNASDILKMFFLQAHYSSPIDFSDKAVEETKAATYGILSALHSKRGNEDAKKLAKKDEDYIDMYKTLFERYMDDDFNMAGARAAIFCIEHYCNYLSGGEKTDESESAIYYAKNMIRKLGGVLGLSFEKFNPHDLRWGDLSAGNIFGEEIIEDKIKERNEARLRKDFKRADEIRKELGEKGIILEDAKEGTIWRRKL